MNDSYLVDVASIAVTVLLIVCLIVREVAAVAGPRFAPLVRGLGRLILPLLIAFGIVVVYRLALLANAR